MLKLTGILNFRTFAEGTKSESLRPYLDLENGSRFLLYKTSDNPFENNAFNGFEGKKITVSGDFSDGVFKVESFEEVPE